jgi:hypothetical protein
MLTSPVKLFRTTLGDDGLRGLFVNEAEWCGELWSSASRKAQHLPQLRTLPNASYLTLKRWARWCPQACWCSLFACAGQLGER